MARITVNFSKEYDDEYGAIIKENNASKVVCEALRDYYKINKNNMNNSDIINKLDVIIDKLDSNQFIISDKNEGKIDDIEDLIDCWEDE